MTKINIKLFALFGNPISHTLSPYIHKLFALQTNVTHEYYSRQVPLDKFNSYVNNFFLNGGYGLNITIPFKEQACLFSDILTNRAKISGSVNTLKKLKNGKIIGDNTDGSGILCDLQRIKFIDKKNNNVLIVGSGGAARGIIYTLLSYGCVVTIVNRTFGRAKLLESKFKNYGQVSVLEYTQIHNNFFNIIINTTINTENNVHFNNISSVIHKDIYCYDINYSKQSQFTPFLIWCLKYGAKKISNGIGMLVSQAAYSFYFWHKVLPNIQLVIDNLTKLYK